MDEGRTPIDLQKFAALRELVWPGGSGGEILRLVERVKADFLINFDDLGRLVV